MKFLGLCGVVIVAVLVGACARTPVRHYDGAPRPAAEVATVLVPEALEVAAIDGREVRGASGLMRGGELRLELLPGRHELLVFYREIWQRGGEHDTLRSDPALFVFDATAGRRYRLDYVRPRRYEEALALSRQFQGWVEDEATGLRVESRASGLEFRKGLVAGLTGDSSLVRTAPAVTGPAATESPAVHSEGDWLPLMKGWWNQASAEERREFLRWIGQRPASAGE
ncbi:DUF2057 family protein [Fontimonas sp. SYSU GA230001]|uniref:DUF2057 family protein n=1 Tax=Fontimonas sp. SYSU GA230001 TaxID=3142450 RepID=UPI0032B39281